MRDSMYLLTIGSRTVVVTEILEGMHLNLNLMVLTSYKQHNAPQAHSISQKYTNLLQQCVSQH